MEEQQKVEEKKASQFTVTLGVVAYNEAGVIHDLLSDFSAQDYPHDQMEVLLVDSASTDTTRQQMEAYAKQCKALGFRRIAVLDNPKRKQAAGWNVVIREAREDILIRIDAHASIPSDFVRKNVMLHMEGERITGGPRPNIIDQPTPWKETLFLAESSMFGSSIAPYRRKTERRYVNSMFHAAYRRSIFQEIGGFNEGLGRTEDNELHYRMRQAGYRFCYDPEIISYQHIRNSFSGMLKQKYGNGYWIGRTVKICPKCLSLYHFVPFLFLLGILATTVLFFLHCMWPGILMWGMYWLLAVGMAVLGILGRETKKVYPSYLLLPILFFCLHLVYGAGTLIGLCSVETRKEV